MRLIYAPLLAGISFGCAATTPPATVHVEPGAGELAAVRSNADAQAQRITELEARLGLLEGATREMRVMLQQRETQRPDVVRIGGPRLPMEELGDASPVPARRAAESVATEERRPLLRSIGEPVAVTRSVPPLPVAPTGVPDRLQVAPLPSVGAATPSASPVVMSERIREEYRAALTLVRNRDFDAALSALTEFLSKYPDQEFTDRAMFWRAEAFYAKRDYERALAEFEALNARFPRGAKVADALLKIGMCHQRLGDEQRAQVIFRRVRDQFPESAAARAASKEGA